MIKNKIDDCFSFNKLNDSCYCLDDRLYNIDCNKCHFYRNDIIRNKIEKDISIYHYFDYHKK